MDYLQKQFLSYLSTNFARVGLKLKPTETWCSKKMFEYGRERRLNGCSTSSGTKHAAKVQSDINDGYSSFQTHVSTLETATEAIARHDYKPDAAFIMYGIFMVDYLFRREIIDTDTPLSKIVALLHYPTCFGGLSVGTLMSHSIRGVDDKLTLWISLHQHLKFNYPVVFKHVINYIEEPEDSTPSWQQYKTLLADPFATRHKQLPNIMSYVRKTIKKELPSLCTNPELQKLIRAPSASGAEEGLVKDIVSMTPYMPTFGHELYRNSASGLLDHFLTRLTSVATISKMVQYAGKMSFGVFIGELDNGIDNDILSLSMDTDFIRKSAMYTAEIVSILQKKLANTTCKCKYYSDLQTKGGCSKVMADDLRKHQWRLPMIGISRPVPMEQGFTIDYDKLDPRLYKKSIMMNVFKQIREFQDRGFTVHGPNSVYYGSSTSERISRPKMSVDNPTPITKAIQALHILLTWAIIMKAVNLQLLIKQLIEEKMPMLPEELRELPLEVWCGAITSGHVLHRMHSAVEHHQCLINYLPTISSYTFSDTTSIYPMVKQGKDYTLYFQMIILYMQTLVLNMHQYRIKMAPQYAFYLGCDTCTQCIDDVKIDLTRVPTYNFNLQLDIYDRTIAILNKPINVAIARRYLSFLYGLMVGSDIDSIRESMFIDSTMMTGTAITYTASKYSLTDFRYVDFDYMLMGIIFQSYNFRQLLKRSRPDLHHSRSRTTVPLATLLIGTSRLSEFITWSGYVATHENQLLQATACAEFLIPALHLKFFSNRQFYLTGPMKM